MSRTGRLLVVALVVLAAGWVLAPRSAPPLYDGLGFPDEPYRFVHAPAGTRVTQRPTVAVGQVGVYGGENDSLTASSAEVAPQVSVTLPAASLQFPASTNTLLFIAQPERMLPAPAGRFLWSNVYDLSIRPAGPFAPGRIATLTVRAATAQQPRPSIARYDRGRWTLLRTATLGQDIYSAEISAFGRYAVIGTVPLDRNLLGAHGNSGGSWIGITVGVAVCGAVVALFLLGRRRRKRARGQLETEPAASTD